MSFYNAINGFNSMCCCLVLPMLGMHPDQYPRFRDCFLIDEDSPETSNKIHIYTRTGGGNTESYIDQIELLRSSKLYIKDYEDLFDQTYRMFVFDVPEQFKDDFDLIVGGNASLISLELIKQIKNVYPKIDKSLFAKFQNNME